MNNLRPSNLLRKGAAIIAANGNKQLFGSLANGEGDACALGAIYVGFGIPAAELSESPLRAGAQAMIFGGLPTIEVILNGKQTPDNATVHLNDSRKWNFESIADYLESVGL